MRSLELWREASPWRNLTTWSKAMDRLLDENFVAQDKNWLNPPVNIEETTTHYEFKFDLPGIKKDDVKIELHNGQLSVSGERREEKEEKSKRRHVIERAYGTFLRTFQLPQDVDSERVQAQYEDGVLHISVPKGEAAKARQITIK